MMRCGNEIPYFTNKPSVFYLQKNENTHKMKSLKISSFSCFQSPAHIKANRNAIVEASRRHRMPKGILSLEQILQSDSIGQARDEIELALANPSLRAPPIPQWIPRLASPSIPKRIKQIQRFILQFQYNHTGVVFYATKRNRGMKHVVYTAKLIMKEALPIQCVQAVFLGVHLTNGLKSVRLDSCLQTERLHLHLIYLSTCDGFFSCLEYLYASSPESARANTITLCSPFTMGSIGVQSALADWNISCTRA